MTDATLAPRMAAVSSAEKASTSRNSNTARWLAGRICKRGHERQLDRLAADHGGLGPFGSDRVGERFDPPHRFRACCLVDRQVDREHAAGVAADGVE